MIDSHFILFDIRPVLALGGALLILGAGCSKVEKLLTNEEIENFRQEGIAAGAGLQAPNIELPSFGGEEQEAPIEERPIAAASPRAEPLIRARLQCRGDTECTSVNREQLVSIGESASEDLLALASGDHPIDLRVEAIRALGWLRLTTARKGLQRLVADRDSLIAQEAMWSLGQLGDPSSVDVLAEQLRSRNARVREAAIRALGNVSSADSVSSLVGIWSRASPSERAAIASALGRTGRPEAREALEDALRDGNEVVRAEARTALVRLGVAAVP